MKSFVPYGYDELEDFNMRRTSYLNCLHENRKELVIELSKKPKDGGIYDILLNPQTEAELDFCSSYLGFLDDNKNLANDIKNGRVKPIDMDNSTGLFYAANIVKSIYSGNEFSYTDGPFYENFSEFARVLYELTVLSKSGDLEQAIAFRNGLSSEMGGLDKSVIWFSINSICNSLINSMHNSKYFSEINRNRFDNENLLYRFVDMADSFHREYLNGVQSGYGSSGVKTDEAIQYVKVGTNI